MDRETIFHYQLKSLLVPIWDFLEDDSVSEIMVNGPSEIYVESKGNLVLTDRRFDDDERLEAACRNIAQYSGVDLRAENRLIDARLPNGARVSMIFPPLTRKGICVAIRKFSKGSLDLSGLNEIGVLTDEATTYLSWCVLTHRNIMIAGGTSSGKTTLLNALSEVFPDTERLFTIEDTFEIQLKQPHVVATEARSNVSLGETPVTIRDLFRQSLRMRPDRIIVGELRGGEALDYLQAMISGHGGSLCTIHADTPRDALHRLETLVVLSGVDVEPKAIRAQIKSAIDVVVQMSRNQLGRRVITDISEVKYDMDPDQYHLNQVFKLARAGEDGFETTLKMTKNKSVLQYKDANLPSNVNVDVIREILPDNEQ